MFTEWQPLVMAVAAVATAVAAVVGGVFTGGNARKRNQIDEESALDAASRLRMADISQDAINNRKLLREADDQHERQTLLLRADRQRGWDLARYHFSLLGFVAQLLQNLLHLESMNLTAENYRAAMRTAAAELRTVKLPVSLEEPIPAPVREAP